MFAAVSESQDVFLNQKFADTGLVEGLIGHLDVGICVVDADLNVVIINGLARKILGFPADLIRPGLTLEVLIRYNAARGDFGEGNVDDLVRERLELARTVEADAFEFTQEDGSTVHVRRSLLPNGGFITTYSGKPTVQQYGEKDFEAALVQLRDVVDKMEQGVILWNGQQCCEIVNQRAFELLDMDESFLKIGMPRLEYLERSSKRGDMSDEQLRLVSKSYEEGEKFRFDRTTPSGRIVTTDAQPRLDGSFVVTMWDVTVRRKREADYIADRNAAQQDAKKQAAFVDNLEQETQSPIRDLLAKAELLAEGELNERQQFLAQTVIKTGQGLQATVSQALGKTGDVREISETVATDTEKYIETADENAQPKAPNLVVGSLDQSDCRPEQQEDAANSYEEPVEDNDTPLAKPKPGEVIKVLIAEDNDANQEVYLELLEGDSYEITCVPDGREAVVQYIANFAKFDVIVMDLTMPNMGGIAATEAIRAHEKVREVPKIPIIGVSAFSTDEYREQAKLVGMNEYLAKPLDVERFFECLVKCAGERSLQNLKEKAQEMADLSGTEDQASTLSIADLARKYQSS